MNEIDEISSNIVARLINNNRLFLRKKTSPYKSREIRISLSSLVEVLYVYKRLNWLFHIINDGFKELFDEDEWKKFNDKNFKYADCSTCSKNLGLDTYKNTNGFFTEYSMTTPSEDMAEVYSHLISGDYKISNDTILNKKIEFIKDKLNQIDSSFEF